MEMKFEDIDKLFNERQNQFDKMPSEALWEQLDKQLPANKPSRKIAYWRYWAAAALVLLCLVPLVWFNYQYSGMNDKAVAAKETAGAAQETKATSSNKKVTKSTDGTAVINGTEEVAEMEADALQEELNQEEEAEISSQVVSAEKKDNNLAPTSDISPEKANRSPLPSKPKQENPIVDKKNAIETTKAPVEKKGEAVAKEGEQIASEKKRGTTKEKMVIPTPQKTMTTSAKESKAEVRPTEPVEEIVEEQTVQPVVKLPADKPLTPEVQKEETAKNNKDIPVSKSRSASPKPLSKPVVAKPPPPSVPTVTEVPAPTPPPLPKPRPAPKKREVVIPPPPPPSEADRGANLPVMASPPPSPPKKEVPPASPASESASSLSKSANVARDHSSKKTTTKNKSKVALTPPQSPMAEEIAAPVVVADEEEKKEVNKYTRYYIAKLTGKIPKIDEKDRRDSVSLDAFAGKWQYVKSGTRYTETWEKMPSGAFRITSVSKRKGQVVHEEKISFQEEGGAWYYNINDPEQGIIRYLLSKQTDELLDLRIVQQTEGYPKRIFYQKKNNKKMYVYFRKDENGKKIKSYITLTK